MKFILLTACIVGMAVCAPLQSYMEFDIRHAPAEAAQAFPVGVPVGTLDVLLPVDDQKRLIGGPAKRQRQKVRGFIRQEILEPNGRDTKDVYYPFGFDLPVAAPAAPVAPAAPAAPVAPVAPAAPAAPVAPVAPVVPIVAASAPAARSSGDDDDDDDDD